MQEDSVYNVTSWMLLQCCHLGLQGLFTIKEMSDRALNCATLLLELQVPVLDELASLLKEWGVGVVVRSGVGQ